MPNRLKNWQTTHEATWQFILFNLLSNCATLTNFVVMWCCTGFVFTPLKTRPFDFLVFHYTDVAHDLGLCGFLSFLAATAAAQLVNFAVQRRFVFKTEADFGRVAGRYAVLAVGLVCLGAALPAYSQRLFMRLGVPGGAVPTLANFVNILAQVAVAYPTMKLWVMPDKKKSG